MAAIDTLRTNTQTALTTLRGDDSGMTPTQVAGANQFVADVAAEVARPGAANVRVQESIASSLPGGLRSGQANVPDITSALTLSVVKDAVMTTFNLTATQAPTAYAATGLPTGMSLNTGTGAITGTPTAAKGQYGVFVSATKSGKTSAVKRMVVTIT